jgi:hypothetical protein
VISDLRGRHVDAPVDPGERDFAGGAAHGVCQEPLRGQVLGILAGARIGEQPQVDGPFDELVPTRGERSDVRFEDEQADQPPAAMTGRTIVLRSETTFSKTACTSSSSEAKFS